MIQGNLDNAAGALQRPAAAAFVLLTTLGLMFEPFPSTATSAELWIGAATADITPDPPVAQEGVNVAATIQNRCLANVLALESRQGDRVLDQAVLVNMVGPEGAQVLVDRTVETIGELFRSGQ